MNELTVLLEQTQMELAAAQKRIASLEAALTQLERSKYPIDPALQQAVQYSWNVFSLVDHDGSIIYVSPAVTNVMGYSTEEYIGVGIMELTHPDDWALAQRILNELLAAPGQQRTFVIRARHRDGRWIWLEMSAANYLDNPDVRAILVNSHDITERKNVEEALHLSEAHLRPLLDSQTTFNIRIDMQGRLSYCNERYRQQFGWVKSPLIGALAFEMVAPADHDHVIDTVAECLLHPDTPIQVELRKPRRDGSYMWTLWEFIAVQDHEGHLNEVQCVGFDISKQKHAEAELQALNASLEKYVRERTAELEYAKTRIEAIFNHSGDGLVLLDVHQGIQQANYAFEHLFGLTTDSYYGVSLAEYVHPRDARQVAAIILDVATLQEVRRVEAQIQRSDGTLVDVEINIAPVTLINHTLSSLVCIIRDITDRKQAQLEIAEERNLLRTVIDAVPDMIYVKDLQHRMVLNNIAHTKALGMNAPADAAGKTDFDLFPAEMAAKFHADEQQIFRTQQAIMNIEERSRSVNGQEMWALTTKVPLRNVQGQVVGLVGITHDVSDIKASQEALQRSEQQFRESQKLLQTVLDTIPVRVFWKDRQSVYLGCNRLFAQDATLAQTADVVGMHDEQMPWATSEAADYRADDRLVMESGIAKLDYEELQTTPAGKQLHLQTSKLPLRDANNNIIGILGAYVDITARKRAEFALRDSESRYRLLAENVRDVIIKLSPEGTLTYVTPSIYNLLGYKPEEIIGHQGAEYAHPDDHLEAQNIIQQSLAERGLYFTLRERLQHRDGHFVWTEIANTNVYDPKTNALVEMVGVLRDISERVRAEEALRQSEARYQSVVQTQSELICRYEPDLTLSFVNNAYCRYFGKSPEQLIGQSFLTLIPESERASVKTFYEELIRSKGTSVYEHQVTFEDGATRWQLWNDVTITNASGDVVAIQAVGVDITERKQAEQALRESEARYRLLAENIRDVIVKVSAAGVITFVTPSCQDFTGHTVEELIGRLVSELVHPDDAHMAQEAMLRMFASNENFFSLVQRVPHKNGSYIWTEITNTVIRSKDNGHILEVISVLRDITERKMAEDALRQSEERYRLLAENVTDIIVKYALDGTCLYITPSVYPILGYAPDELIGHKLLDVICVEDRPQVEDVGYKAVAEGTTSFTVVMRARHHDGHYVWSEASNTIIRDPLTGQPIECIAVFRDITERKQAEEMLRQALAQEKELGELKSRFVTLASHEFRTPLAAILAVTETLTFYREKMTPPQIDSRLDKIRGQVNHMKDIMEDLLHLARIQARRVEFSPMPGDLHELCQDIVEEFDGQPQYRGRLHYECPLMPVPLSFDPRLMRQTVSNLIANALKYSPNDKPVHVTLTHDDTHITLRVRDAGIGIPPEDLKRLFEPFHRAANVGTISGTGLGLSIARQALEMHQGSITPESQLGQGTTFTVIIPK
ncbi:MAG: PAS domain S-box protein [Anaerolineae bacterium]